MSYEKRKTKRRHLVFYLQVLNAERVCVGWIADITAEGMMLVAHTPLPQEQAYIFTICIPQELSVNISEREIQVEATIQWVRPDKNPEYVLMGCKFLDPLPEVQSVIQKLIQVYAFEDKTFVHPAALGGATKC